MINGIYDIARVVHENNVTQVHNEEFAGTYINVPAEHPTGTYAVNAPLSSCKIYGNTIFEADWQSQANLSAGNYYTICTGLLGGYWVLTLNEAATLLEIDTVGGLYYLTVNGARIAYEAENAATSSGTALSLATLGKTVPTPGYPWAWVDVNQNSNMTLVRTGDTSTQVIDLSTVGKLGAIPNNNISSNAEYIGNEQWRITKEYRDVVLNGTETIAAYNYKNSRGVFFFDVLTEPSLREVGVSTHCDKVGQYYSNPPYMWTGISNTTLFWVGILDYLGMTLSQFKVWVADQYASGTPVVVRYRLSTAVTEVVSLPELTAVQGTNSIYTQATLINPNLAVSLKCLGNQQT